MRFGAKKRTAIDTIEWLLAAGLKQCHVAVALNVHKQTIYRQARLLDLPDGRGRPKKC